MVMIMLVVHKLSYIHTTAENDILTNNINKETCFVEHFVTLKCLPAHRIDLRCSVLSHICMMSLLNGRLNI